MAYFTIMTGLRGCYMPDQVYVIRATTRRALKDVLTDEARLAQSDNERRYSGLSKREIARHAAWCWSHRDDATWHMDAALPYGQGKARPFGIFVSRATRDDFLAAQQPD